MDHEGSMHPDLDAALKEGYDSAREIMKSQLDDGYIDFEQQIEIFAETGEMLAIIPFSTAIRRQK